MKKRKIQRDDLLSLKLHRELVAELGSLPNPLTSNPVVFSSYHSPPSYALLIFLFWKSHSEKNYFLYNILHSELTGTEQSPAFQSARSEKAVTKEKTNFTSSLLPWKPENGPSLSRKGQNQEVIETVPT